MNLQQVKEILNKTGFSAESLEVMNEVIDKAIKDGDITEEAKNKLMAIIDIEIEAANLEADAMEEVAMALESFAYEVDKAVIQTEQDLESVSKNLLDNVKGIANQASTSQ